MTHAPLIFTDTTMALMERYLELDDDYWAIYDVLETRFDEPVDHEWRQWEDTHHNALQTRQVVWHLMHEIWLLWTFGKDVPLTRRLNWHFAFDALLTDMAKSTFIPPQQYPRRNLRFMTKQPIETKWFIEALEIAYKKALVTRSFTSSNGV